MRHWFSWVLSIITLLVSIPVFAQQQMPEVTTEVLEQLARLEHANGDIPMTNAVLDRLQALPFAAVLPVLLQEMTSPHDIRRTAAVGTLGNLLGYQLRTNEATIDESVVQALAERLQNDTLINVRIGATFALGLTNHDAALTPLHDALSDGQLGVRKGALSGVLALKRRESAPWLVEAIDRDEDLVYGRAIIQQLAQWAARRELELLREKLDSQELVTEVERWLGELGQQQAREDAVAQAYAEVTAEPVPPPPSPGMRWKQMLFKYRVVLLPLATILQFLPVLGLLLWQRSSLGRSAWRAKIFAVGLRTMLALLVIGGVAFTFSICFGYGRAFFGTFSLSPLSGAGRAAMSLNGLGLLLGTILLPLGLFMFFFLPFIAASVAVPVALCGMFGRLQWRKVPLPPWGNAAVWTVLYLTLQLGTWKFVPQILQGEYFHYDRARAWPLLQLVLALGVFLAVGLFTRWQDMTAGSKGVMLPQPGQGFVLALVMLVSGMGYLLQNIYDY